jgi:hypothetical protein
MAQRPPFSPEYLALLEKGAFPNRIDPWAESGRYFQQIHSGIIGHLLKQIRMPLLALGYVAGRETSLIVLERREPDIYVRLFEDAPPKPRQTLNYPAAAAQILAATGFSVETDIHQQQAIFIEDMQSGQLITIVEVVSPANKIAPREIAHYQARRQRFLSEGINIVEIDLTRSVTRLLESKMINTYAYHIAVYLPHELPHVIGVDFYQGLPRIALPLHAEVVAVELQLAYDDGYQTASIPVHIRTEGHYTDAHLPFPTTLTSAQRQQIQSDVDAWHAELKRLLDYQLE